MSPESKVQSPQSCRGSRVEGRGSRVEGTHHASRFTVHSSRFTLAGSVLFTTLFLVGILGLTLASYLLWVGKQNVLVTESHAWNAALANAEAGIEEGMAQVNVFYGNVLNVTNYYLSAQTNWGQAAGVFGPRTNTLISGSYSATIQPNSPGPTITSV